MVSIKDCQPYEATFTAHAVLEIEGRDDINVLVKRSGSKIDGTLSLGIGFEEGVEESLSPEQIKEIEGLAPIIIAQASESVRIAAAADRAAAESTEVVSE